MLFTTSLFLFIYMPICFLLTFGVFILEKVRRVGLFLQKNRIRDLMFIGLGLAFYMWAGVDNVFRFLFYILLVYFLAFWMEKTFRKKLCLAVSVILLAFILIYVRYFNFLVRGWNWFFGDSIQGKSLIVLLGLSFITFSAISYLVDIYRGDAARGSLIDCALYLTFFPKVISGPIVLWKDFQMQISERSYTLENCVDGMNRIMVGFAKKILLADVFGACLTGISLYGIDRVTAFGSMILYMLQIYFDFSGYSDIAIGLSRLLGFHVKENFCFPYRSTSISEFWRRWHISLGTWFREYVYIPLGGSRTGMRRTLRNLAVVFALTGLWHGAGVNYVLWGGINGALVIVERILRNRSSYQKIPRAIRYAATMLIVLLFWQLFRFSSVRDVGRLLGIILGTVRFDRVYYTWQHYFDVRLIVFALIGILGATVLGSPVLQRKYRQFTSTKIGYVVQELCLLLLFVLSILFMVNSTYSPFIYFQY